MAGEKQGSIQGCERCPPLDYPLELENEVLVTLINEKKGYLKNSFSLIVKHPLKSGILNVVHCTLGPNRPLKVLIEDRQEKTPA
jgi:hypothetical protein